MAATFLVQPTPTGKKEYEGGLNLDNVTEELLNGFFCHYEPPTSENAQFKAARLARADPVKYSNRPVAKPILRTPSLHPKNKRKNKSGEATATSKAGAHSNSAANSSGKSVTWRDEKANSDRNKVEREVVGCAANYCGLFQQGEGLTDVLMSPAEKAAAAKAAKAFPKNKSASSDRSVDDPKSPSSAVSRTDSADGSMTSNGSSSSSKKRLTPIMTSRNKKNRTSPSASSVDASLTSGKQRILYDDLGNPIAESDAEDETLGFDESIPGTPVTLGTPGSMAGTPRTLPDGGMDTPTAEKAGATTMDANNPLAFFCTVPAVVFGAATIAAASAAEAVGYKPTPTASKTNTVEAPGTPGASPSSPAILRRPAPSDHNAGVMAEYRDEIGAYEPLDYNNPFPNTYRDPSSGLAYKRVRSPPARRRQPTPRRPRGMSARYEEELYDEEDYYYTQGMMDDGAVVSSLGKVPRQSIGTFDTSAARQQSPRQPIARVYRGQDLSPSTITGGASYHYERDASGRCLRPAKSPGRRSDMYSELTTEEEAYIYYQSPKQPPVYYEEDAYARDPRSDPRRRSRGERVEEEARRYYEQERALSSGRRSIGSEGQLSPRAYAERLLRQRHEPTIEVDEDPQNDEPVENLSPREYAEKLKEQRTSISEVKEIPGDHSTGRESKKGRKSQSKKTKDRRQHADPNTEAKRDPTPRNKIDPVESDTTENKEQLPPTPRKNDDIVEENPNRRDISNTPESHASFDFSKETLKKRNAMSHESPSNQFSPRSMATDDEIREEVSSVGMASDTIRPLYYANPFLNVPPAVLEDEEQNLPLDQLPLKQLSDLDPSTLSGSGSTLSSKPSAQNSGRSSQKHRSKAADSTPPAISNSSSGSTRSKKLWKGWKKTMGKVKKIVQDIDEQRIHPPQLNNAMNVKA